MSPELSDKELLRRYHVEGDLSAREQLIERYLSLVRSLARRYAYRGEQLDDLVQIGCIGLIKAIDRFDIDRGVELTTYATPNIIGEIKRHFRDKGWAVRVPRGLQELNVQLSKIVEDQTVQLGRSPTIPELAKAAGVEEEEVLEALESGRAYTSLSLSASGSDEDGELVRVADLDPAAPVALAQLDAVHDGVQEPAQAERAPVVAAELGDRLGPERADPCLQRALGDREDDRDLSVRLVVVEQAVEGELEVVEDVEGDVVAGGDAAEHEPCDRAEGPLPRQREDDLVHQAAGPSASRSSSARSRSRRAAASLATRMACWRSCWALKAATPWVRPAARPEIFCTGRAIAMLTARTAVSTLSAMSTALSVTRSTLSSCPLTLSTLSPTLWRTGSSSCSVPLINEERRPKVPPRRKKA
jgi:RNA polymerase sigma-B factor